jgi:curved DNA-binding protein CbpA
MATDRGRGAGLVREVLGVDRSAGRAEIVAAYRDKAKRAHPDAGGSHEAMTALVRARDQALAAIR